MTRSVGRAVNPAGESSSRIFFVIILAMTTFFLNCHSEDLSPETAATIIEPTPAPAEAPQPISTPPKKENNWDTFTEKQFKELLADQPENPRVWQELGRFYWEHQEIEGRSKKENSLLAKNALRKALELDPANRTSYDLLNRVYGDLVYDDASLLPEREALLKNAMDQFPDLPWPSYQLGLIYFDYWRQGQKAEEYAKQALKLSVKADDAWNHFQVLQLLGRIYMGRGDAVQAEKYFIEAATKLEEQKKENNYNYPACPYSALGKLYTMLGKPGKAAKSFMDAADLEPHQSRKQALAAYKSYVVADYANALKYIDRALAIESENSYREFKGYILLFMRKYEKARVWFEKSLSKDPADLGACVGQGHLAIINKDYGLASELFHSVKDKAEEKFRDELQNGNSIPGAYDLARLTVEMVNLGLAWIEANQNRHETAIKYYDKILDLNSENLLAQLGKANSLGGANRLDEAEKAYRQILAKYPENPHALSELGRILFSRGLDEEAEEYYKRALKIDSAHYTCPYEGLGLVYLKRGKTDLAARNFKKAIKIGPDMEYKKYNGLAKIYINEGKYKKAGELLKKSIENFPYDDEAKELMKKLDAAIRAKQGK